MPGASAIAGQQQMERNLLVFRYTIPRIRTRPVLCRASVDSCHLPPGPGNGRTYTSKLPEASDVYAMQRHRGRMQDRTCWRLCGETTQVFLLWDDLHLQWFGRPAVQIVNSRLCRGCHGAPIP